MEVDSLINDLRGKRGGEERAGGIKQKSGRLVEKTLKSLSKAGGGKRNAKSAWGRGKESFRTR